MIATNKIKIPFYASLIVLGIAMPFLFPAYLYQFATLWIMIVLALTWDLQGGQMGYNSLGNIFFFGFGMYVSAVVQIGLVHEVANYTAASGGGIFLFTPTQYFVGLTLGLIAAGVASVIAAILLGWIVFGLRGPYFTIATLGLAIAAGQLASTWNWLGAGQGIVLPTNPLPTGTERLFVYFLCFILAVILFIFLKWLYSTRFAYAINAIRDDEEKAEGMGIHTLRYKSTSWAISAFFLGIAGSIFGNMSGFIDPFDVAFQVVSFNIFMIAMALLGGKGTLWGPIIGAVLFQSIKELTWTHMLGWQWVALGSLIVIILVFFHDGIMGWIKYKKPEWFGIRIETKSIHPKVETAK